jgi:hypothetical protein
MIQKITLLLCIVALTQFVYAQENARSKKMKVVEKRIRD